MKKITGLVLLASLASCTKKDKTEPPLSASDYIIRVAAVDNDGSKSFTTFSRVKSGKVAIEYETTSVYNVKQYDVEVSPDGVTFTKVKTIAADLNNPDKVYRDTLILK